MNWNQPVIKTTTKRAQSLCAEFVSFLRRKQKVAPEVFVLGADDPEMSAIERLLVWLGKEVHHATRDGKRVLPHNAYDADPIHVAASSVVLIECRPRNLSSDFGLQIKTKPSVFRIDHHEPGDSGFQMSPQHFWEASSIGQLYKLLELGEPTKEHRILAAMDHCPASAWQGNCPGVTPEEVQALEVKVTLERKGVDHAAFEECMERMRELVTKGTMVIIGKQRVVDTTSTPIEGKSPEEDGYSIEYLCMKLVLAGYGLAGLVATKDKEGGIEKVVMYGNAHPETVEAFMSTWAPHQGLIRVYGAPERAYAGGWCSK